LAIRFNRFGNRNWMITILPSIVRLAKDQNLVVSALLLIEEPTSLDLIATIRGRGAAPGKEMGTTTGTGCGGSGGGLLLCYSVAVHTYSICADFIIG